MAKTPEQIIREIALYGEELKPAPTYDEALATLDRRNLQSLKNNDATLQERDLLAKAERMNEWLQNTDALGRPVAAPALKPAGSLPENP